MVRENEIRSAERAVEWRDATDAGLLFIGRIRTPWTSRMKCPRQGRADGPTCRIEVFPPWTEALAGITDYVGDGEDFVVLRHPIVCTLHSTAGPSRLTPPSALLMRLIRHIARRFQRDIAMYVQI